MSEYQKIPLLNICSLNNFPFIEADFDAVTYYQLLCKIVESVNSTIELTNNLLDEYEEIEEEYNRLIALVNELQTRLDTIQEELTAYIDLKTAETKAELEAEINDLASDLRSEVAEAIALVNTTLEEFRTEVTELEDYVNDQILNFKNYTDSKFSLLDAKYTLITNDLQNQINQLPDSIPTVYNPASGNNESLQTALNDFWTWLRYDGMLTASQYDSLNITAGDYDNMQIKARDFDLYAKKILIN
jgi:Skp family chaperone for outer membrane proteins